MNRCPACGRWTLSFDQYFGRFRCTDSDCGWMPPSSTEREIRLLEKHKQPTKLGQLELRDLGIKIVVSYDEESDALLFDFGIREAAFEVPEPDGRMMWRIAHRTGEVTGFTIFRAQRLGLAHVEVNIAARKQSIERGLKAVPSAFVSGRATRLLIDEVAVKANYTESTGELDESESQTVLRDAFEKLTERFPPAGTEDRHAAPRS